MRRISRGTWIVMVSAALVGAAIAFPLGTIASHQFGDVPTSDQYHTDIDAIADAGVTLGCGGGNYCPDDFVTREQMAAFMNRLGALGPGKQPVVNADRVDGVDDVLGAGPIVNIQQGPWFPGGSSSVTTLHFFDVDTIFLGSAGTGVAIMSLDGPTSIGGTAYGLASVEVCHGGVTATISVTKVAQSVSPGSSVDRIVDTTDRPITADTCFTVTDPTPDAKQGATHLVLEIDFDDAGSTVWMSNITTTWVPVA